MQSRGSGNLERKSSQLSTSSHRSAGGRTRSRKQSLVTPNSAKSLVSFPSLSPENSPGPGDDDKFVSDSVNPPNIATPRKPSTNGPSIVETLIRSTPSFRGRSALFGDSPKGSGKDVPGALHLADDDHLQSFITKSGAVNLVRQLAKDLAQRDAEMTTLRRLAEERERELKRMLREAEVSNLDIETRLHRVGKLNEIPRAAGSQDSTQEAESKKAGPRDRITSVTNGIDKMMGEAMKDDVGMTELDENYLDSLDDRDRQATIKAAGMSPRGNDGRSTHSSVDSQGRARNVVKGWKDFLWNGNLTSRKTSRTSSIISENGDEGERARKARAPSGNNNDRRMRLNEDLFQPPQRTLTSNSVSSDSQSRNSSMSVTSWTLKLFAGNPQAGRDSENHHTVRGRSATTGSGAGKASRAPSNASGPPLPTSAKAALMKVNNMGGDGRSLRKPVQPLTIGPNGSAKVISQPSSSQLPSSPKSSNSATNLGPVEMDRILPLDSRPPTQTQSTINDQSSEFLTDRFGFIYDQRRRRREANALTNKPNSGIEMLSGSRDLKAKEKGSSGAAAQTVSLQRPETPASIDDKANEKPTKRWQDYLKVATFPTELLLHTPSSNPITSVTSIDIPSPLKRSATFVDARGSLPSTSLNPKPSASPITARNAEIAKPSANSSASQSTPATGEAEPVKMLLAQLTELHDSLQRDRTLKWNEFLRKVRAERKKEGEAAPNSDTRSKNAMPEATLADGEMIGVAGLGNKGKVGRAKWKELKQLILAGIPVAYRAKIWAECSGASVLRIPGYYDDLVSNGTDDPAILAQIQMDINRTLTDNVFFRRGPGVAKLNEVLLAYSRRNPEVGYCQGMNLITASLLLIMPSAEDAFWVLTSMIENILPRHYYDNSLLASRADQQVLRQYVSEILPRLSAHLDELGIELEALTFQWFLSVFTDCLSAEALFRVWDVVLCFNDGSTFLFQVALALLKLNEGALLECSTAAGVYGYIGHEMTDHAISIDGLVRASDGLKTVVKRSEVDERRRRAVEEEMERVRNGSGESANRSGDASRSGSEGELRVRDPMPVDDEGC